MTPLETIAQAIYKEGVFSKQKSLKLAKAALVAAKAEADRVENEAASLFLEMLIEG